MREKLVRLQLPRYMGIETNSERLEDILKLRTIATSSLYGD